MSGDAPRDPAAPNVFADLRAMFRTLPADLARAIGEALRPPGQPDADPAATVDYPRRPGPRPDTPPAAPDRPWAGPHPAVEKVQTARQVAEAVRGVLGNLFRTPKLGPPSAGAKPATQGKESTGVAASRPSSGSWTPVGSGGTVYYPGVRRVGPMGSTLSPPTVVPDPWEGYDFRAHRAAHPPRRPRFARLRGAFGRPRRAAPSGSGSPPPPPPLPPGPGSSPGPSPGRGPRRRFRAPKFRVPSPRPFLSLGRRAFDSLIPANPVTGRRFGFLPTPDFVARFREGRDLAARAREMAASSPLGSAGLDEILKVARYRAVRPAEREAVGKAVEHARDLQGKADLAGRQYRDALGKEADRLKANEAGADRQFRQARADAARAAVAFRSARDLAAREYQKGQQQEAARLKGDEAVAGRQFRQARAGAVHAADAFKAAREAAGRQYRDALGRDAARLDKEEVLAGKRFQQARAGAAGAVDAFKSARATAEKADTQAEAAARRENLAKRRYQQAVATANRAKQRVARADAEIDRLTNDPAHAMSFLKADPSGKSLQEAYNRANAEKARYAKVFAASGRPQILARRAYAAAQTKTVQARATASAARAETVKARQAFKKAGRVAASARTAYRAAQAAAKAGPSSAKATAAAAAARADAVKAHQAMKQAGGVAAKARDAYRAAQAAAKAGPSPSHLSAAAKAARANMAKAHAALKRAGGVASGAMANLRAARAAVRAGPFAPQAAAAFRQARVAARGAAATAQRLGAGAARLAAARMGFGATTGTGGVAGALGSLGGLAKAAGGAATGLVNLSGQVLRTGLAMRNYADHVAAQARRAGAFSGTVQVASAQLAIGDIYRHMRYSRATEETGADLLRGVNVMRDRWQGYDIGVGNLQNRFARLGGAASGVIGVAAGGVAQGFDRASGFALPALSGGAIPPQSLEKFSQTVDALSGALQNFLEKIGLGAKQGPPPAAGGQLAEWMRSMIAVLEGVDPAVRGLRPNPVGVIKPALRPGLGVPRKP